ncbi:lysylphosphatidylglycerol synthase domain-containing protein [Rhizobium sp. CNPSo 3968]|uniref:lysylphosphatidylglycerol synthase domain-containing protein n=1 Tax=Rhizobium sp. CNPSo 3968 TaxID=3021408 RepID=UPI00254D20C9|nr:lysylphosphatidylglycerol synthase domain-containing protein [Rhizobium sp. CNPSo 3968]MDK4718644.1 lysylphosphatidylglycerol synthase domain-containing protein [Rhizobium sp. CNPSo 3968]
MTLKGAIWNAAIFGALCLALFLLYRILSHYSLEEIGASLHQLPFPHLAAAFLCAVASYICLTGFDYLAILSLGKFLPYPKIALASFISLSMGHSIGFAGLSSGAFRYRYYARWGLSMEDVAKIILFSGVTVALGLITIGGIALLVDSDDIVALSRADTATLRILGGALLCIPASYGILARYLRGRLTLWNWSFALPRAGIALAQIAIGTANFAFVSACLYALFSAYADLSYFRTIAAFVLANTLVLTTHVPGGLGVLEAVLAYAVPNAASIGALIVFRLIYYLIPLLVGAIAMLTTELVFRRHSAKSQHAAQPASKTM